MATAWSRSRLPSGSMVTSGTSVRSRSGRRGAAAAASASAWASGVKAPGTPSSPRRSSQIGAARATTGSGSVKRVAGIGGAWGGVALEPGDRFDLDQHGRVDEGGHADHGGDRTDVAEE